MRNALKFVKPSEVQGACQALVDDDAGRVRYAVECYELFRQRDIRDVITDFFS